MKIEKIFYDGFHEYKPENITSVMDNISDYLQHFEGKPIDDPEYSYSVKITIIVEDEEINQNAKKTSNSTVE